MIWIYPRKSTLTVHSSRKSPHKRLLQEITQNSAESKLEHTDENRTNEGSETVAATIHWSRQQ